MCIIFPLSLISNALSAGIGADSGGMFALPVLCRGEGVELFESSAKVGGIVKTGVQRDYFYRFFCSQKLMTGGL